MFIVLKLLWMGMEWVWEWIYAQISAFTMFVVEQWLCRNWRSSLCMYIFFFPCSQLGLLSAAQWDILSLSCTLCSLAFSGLVLQKASTSESGSAGFFLFWSSFFLSAVSFAYWNGIFKFSSVKLPWDGCIAFGAIEIKYIWIEMRRLAHLCLNLTHCPAALNWRLFTSG